MGRVFEPEIMSLVADALIDTARIQKMLADKPMSETTFIKILTEIKGFNKLPDDVIGKLTIYAELEKISNSLELDQSSLDRISAIFSVHKVRGDKVEWRYKNGN